MTVAVVQLSRATAGISALVQERVTQAAEQGARLVVLPIHLPAEPGARAAFLAAAAQLAQACQVVLAPGSYLEPIVEPVASDVYRTAPVFGPDGQSLGWIRQTHRSAADRSLCLRTADRLPIIETPVGRLGILLAEDIRYPEVGRILALQGAEILIYLPAGRATFHEEAWLAGLWREVQANQTFGLECWPVGSISAATDSQSPESMPWLGRSAILAPCEMTPGQTGILAQAPTLGDEHVLLAELDFAARQRVVTEYPIFRYFNCDLYRRELPVAYEVAGLQSGAKVG